MGDIRPWDGGRLAGRTIAILMEGDFVEPEVHYYQRRFAEEGAHTEFLTRLWGQRELTFNGHEYQQPFTVNGDLEAVDEERLRAIDALIVPSGMVSDRLRYSEDIDALAPATRLLKRAFAIPPVPAVRRIETEPATALAPAGTRAPATTGSAATGAPATTTPATANGSAATNGSAPRAVTALTRPGVVVSDLVAGYVTRYDADSEVVELRTSDGWPVRTRLTGTVSAEFLRNLGDPRIDASAHLPELLTPGRQLFVHGLFYPDDDAFDAKRLVFLGRRPEEYDFEKPDWWVRQIQELGRFYRRAQFGSGGPIDFADYRTVLRLGGEKADHHIQETDTISRLVYGMSSAYMLTGDEDFLDVAEQGAKYLRDHMRFVDRDEDVVYWYHGIDVTGGGERKLFTSEFSDDYDAIPMYEQIYALAGPTQLYRVTGDPRISADIEGTLRLFQRFFRDEERGGYFSHIDPITLSPHHETLGTNRSRKNWNSVGDHAPAYLFNLFLATGDDRHAAMLEETFDLIVEHLPGTDSPFVQERFHADWSPDYTWDWQQNRAVIGHNLKIAWNLMRMMAVRPKDKYRKLADHIGRTMPEFGSDRQRGGWYDVIERTLGSGETRHRLTWHNRKAWWQQEQAILAYQILAGHTGDQEFLRQAREAAAFYNAFFLDHDEGGVYFNVLADGTPYLLGTERLKGSHSMSMCHAAELCYLAAVYERLLLNDEPLTLWFRPSPGGFTDRVLRVAPDALPPGRVRLDWVEVDGRPYSAFDPLGLTVKLPDSESPLTVRAHLAPAGDPPATG